MVLSKRSLVLLIPQLLLAHVCTCTHTNMHCHLFVHIAVKPTVPELCFELEELVDWEKTVIHLPEMSSAEVQKVKRDEPKVDQRKQEAFDTWLRRCPEASWSHVRDALRKAGEYTLEKKIATNHGLSSVFSEEPSRRTQYDTAITCPRTAVQTGSMTVDASRDPQHGSHYPNLLPPTQDPPLGKIIYIMNDNDVYLAILIGFYIMTFTFSHYLTKSIALLLLVFKY